MTIVKGPRRQDFLAFPIPLSLNILNLRTQVLCMQILKTYPRFILINTPPPSDDS